MGQSLLFKWPDNSSTMPAKNVATCDQILDKRIRFFDKMQKVRGQENASERYVSCRVSKDDLALESPKIQIKIRLSF